jgi:energy-coupling factor transporter transmembrane protein EcfT
MIEIITLIILMVIIFLILFWLKKFLFLFGFFFKLFLLVLLLIVVGGLFTGYLVVKDANNFKNNFGNTTSMVIVQETNTTANNGTFLAGVTFNPKTKEFSSMSKKDLTNAQALYNKGQISTLGTNYYKVFIVQLKSFDEISLYNISDQNVELSKDEIKQVMLSDNARVELATIIAKKNGQNVNDVLNKLSATNEGVKGYLLSYYLTTVFNPSNIGEFLSQLKNDNIKVYENTALFKAIKFVPQSLINIASNKQVTNVSNSSTAS